MAIFSGKTKNYDDVKIILRWCQNKTKGWLKNSLFYHDSIIFLSFWHNHSFLFYLGKYICKDPNKRATLSCNKIIYLYRSVAWLNRSFVQKNNNTTFSLKRKSKKWKISRELCDCKDHVTSQNIKSWKFPHKTFHLLLVSLEEKIHNYDLSPGLSCDYVVCLFAI